jgi:hypothetical protein
MHFAYRFTCVYLPCRFTCILFVDRFTCMRFGCRFTCIYSACRFTCMYFARRLSEATLLLFIFVSIAYPIQGCTAALLCPPPLQGWGVPMPMGDWFVLNC